MNVQQSSVQVWIENNLSWGKKGYAELVYENGHKNIFKIYLHTGTSDLGSEFVCVITFGHSSENFDMAGDMIWNVPTLSSSSFNFVDEIFASVTSRSTVT